ncbi:VOC family protein [Burkholderia cepacia]|uniref:bleomycin resistance protein n=1 Tax=Burkholderia cepacia TaxID=292 RepID=UPI002ABD68B5|nr:bleomycin resistance protein [Burkholderia cepacia]
MLPIRFVASPSEEAALAGIAAPQPAGVRLRSRPPLLRKTRVAETWHDRGWIRIERRDPLLKFHPHRKFNAATSWFSRRFRLANFRTLFDDVLAAGIPEQTTG